MPLQIPPLQVAQPVTAFYQGRALRQQEQIREQEAELLGLQIQEAKYKVSPEAMQAAAEEAKREIEKHNADIAKSAAETSDKMREVRGKAYGPIFAQVVEDVQAGENVDMKAITSQLVMAARSIGEDELAELVSIVDVNQDNVFSPEEFAMAAGVFEIEQEGADWVPMTREEKAAEDIPETSFAQKNTKTGERKIDDPPREGPLTTVNIEKGATAATEAYGKGVGEMAVERETQAMATYQEDASLSRLELSLSRGARSGWGESVILDIRSALDTFGVLDLPEGAQESEVIRSVGNLLALRLRNPASGLGLTGNTSNKDLDFLKDSVAGISRSEEGNRLLIIMAKRLNEFKRAIASEQAKIITAEGGSVPTDLNSKLMLFANNYQMFTDQEKKEIDGLVKASSDSPPENPSDISDDEVLKRLGLNNAY